MERVADDDERQPGEGLNAVTLEDLFQENASFCIIDLEAPLKTELGFMPFFETIRLCRRWNSMAPSTKQIQLSPLTDRAKNNYRQELAKMRAFVLQSKRLYGVFPESWFHEVEKKIDAWDCTDSISFTTHTAFVAFSQDETWGFAGTPLLEEVDDAFAIFTAATGTRLKSKLRHAPGPLDAFIATVFEILVLKRFVQSGLKNYEPRISSGVPEARIHLGGHDLIIEARATLDVDGTDGCFDPYYLGRKLADKVREKYAGQLSGAQEPVVLFLGLNVGVHRLHIEAMLNTILQDSASTILSAIVLSETYKACEFEVWQHPYARCPLPDASAAALRHLLSAKDFVSRGLVRYWVSEAGSSMKHFQSVYPDLIG